MRDAAYWAKVAMNDAREAIRAGATPLAANLTAQLELRFRAAQLDAIHHCTAQCAAVARTLPRLSHIGASRCLDALADVAVRVHREGATGG